MLAGGSGKFFLTIPQRSVSWREVTCLANHQRVDRWEDSMAKGLFLVRAEVANEIVEETTP